MKGILEGLIILLEESFDSRLGYLNITKLSSPVGKNAKPF